MVGENHQFMQTWKETAKYATAVADGAIGICHRPGIIRSIKAHAITGSASTCQVYKHRSGTAAASGTPLLSTATAMFVTNTVTSGPLTSNQLSLSVDKDDIISIVGSFSLTAGLITVEIQAV